MGYESAEWKVSVTLNRHNSWRDRRDDGLWLLLQSRLQEVCADSLFEEISPMITGWSS